MEQIFLGAIGGAILLLMLRRLYLGLRVTSRSSREISERLNQTREIVLLDVRTASERSRSRIDGSLHIPLAELRDRMDQLEKYRQKEIICYCQTGSRSLSAAALLQKRGFSVVNMKGGIAEWNFQHR